MSATGLRDHPLRLPQERTWRRLQLSAEWLIVLVCAWDDVINFPDGTAFGTSTATSLPCLFSIFGREHFDRAAIAAHESLLDVRASV